MQRTSVRSSNLRSIGYDEESRVLEIEFHSGGVYRYYDVPKRVYNGLMNAGSHGKYHARNIKEVYRDKKVS